MVILSAIQFEWTIGAQFTLNFYHNWANMAVHNVDGSGHFLQIKKKCDPGVSLCHDCVWYWYPPTYS